MDVVNVERPWVVCVDSPKWTGTVPTTGFDCRDRDLVVSDEEVVDGPYDLTRRIKDRI